MTSCFRIMSHNLDIEYAPADPNTPKLNGYRIVELGYVLDWAMTLQLEHNRHCTSGRLLFKNEKLFGFVSVLQFECNICHCLIEKRTENPSHEKSFVNYGAVWGTLSSGSSYSTCKEIFGIMDIPCLPYRLFHQIENELGDQ